MEPTPEDHFRRWSEHGDASALGRVFDACAPELAGIAGHLARDAETARDLVQDTFLVALERADRWDPERPLMPWLVGILSHRARDRRRRERRFLDPRRLLRREPERPDEALERGELVRSVGRALERLPEAYREALFAHLVEGLAPREIAARTGEAPGTVRVRLHRGFGLLREQLPSGLTGAAVVPAAQLAEVRHRFVQAALHPPRPTWVKLALALPVAGVACLGAGALLRGTGPDAPEAIVLTGGAADPELVAGAGRAPRPAARPVRLEGADPEETGGRAGEGPAVRAPRATAPEEPPPVVEPDTGLVLEGRVVADVDLALVPATVRVRATGSGLVAATTCAADGRFELDVESLLRGEPELDGYVLVVDHPECVPLREPLVDRVPRGRTTRGRVGLGSLNLRAPRHRVEPRLANHPRADWALFAVGKRGERHLLDEALASAAPSLRVERGGDYELVACVPDHPPLVHEVRLGRPPGPDLGGLELPPGVDLEGRLNLPVGVEVDGAELVLVPDALARRLQVEPDEVPRWNDLAHDGETWVWTERSAPVADRRFRVPGLGERAHTADLRAVPGYHLPHGLGPMRVRAGEFHALLTPHLARVELRTVDRGEPVAGARVTVAGVELPTSSDVDGRLEVLVPADLGLPWLVEAEGYEPKATTRLGPVPGAGARWTEMLVPVEGTQPPQGDGSPDGASDDGGR